jgi:hypothetical protein
MATVDWIPTALEVEMKMLLSMAAVLTLMGSAAFAADPTPIPQDKCIPGVTAELPNGCSLPGFDWIKTIYFTHDGQMHDAWMLSPKTASMPKP